MIGVHLLEIKVLTADLTVALPLFVSSSFVFALKLTNAQELLNETKTRKELIYAVSEQKAILF
jgi:hypothetical protein